MTCIGCPTTAGATGTNYDYPPLPSYSHPHLKRGEPAAASIFGPGAIILAGLVDAPSLGVLTLQLCTFGHRHHHSYSVAFPRRWQCMESIVRCIPPSRPPVSLPWPSKRCCRPAMAAAAARERESCCFQILLAAAAAAVSITSRQPVGQDDGLNGGHGRLPIFSTAIEAA